MLTAMVKHLLPRVGSSVAELHLGYSRGLSNGVVSVHNSQSYVNVKKSMHTLGVSSLIYP